MVTYKGLPAPLICDYLSREASKTLYAPGTEFQIGKIELVANTGTYVDSPFHRYPHGKDLSELPLESLANLPCRVVRIPADSDRAIDRLPISQAEARGCAVLIQTGWDRHWRTDRYFETHPHLTGELAEWLVRAGAALVGIDSFNIDSIDTGERPVHSLLLGLMAGGALGDVLGAALRLFPWYREDLVKSPFYDLDPVSQTVSALGFAGLCAYLWLGSMRRARA